MNFHEWLVIQKTETIVNSKIGTNYGTRSFAIQIIEQLKLKERIS